ncbi:PfkB family carbohydrate kinase [Agromyces atrinae]|uniref:PfkB family carbohydrate kinase n=1 Tax=Agromyces atrinae TaxID=592376 RepID=UPI001F588335|nr:PfkB family carbohydrate kinase [Agromyces atrinae]MCI2957391.1 PfkB family carbohydrate kinase [Agromyces atrinae]
MSDTPRICVIGDALVDEIRDADGIRAFPGGAALNVAVGLAVLGVPTTLITMLGADEEAELIRGFLEGFGVELIETTSTLGTARAISHRVDGEPHYEFNEAAQGRHIAFTAAAHVALEEAPLIVVSCVALDSAAQFEELVAATSGRAPLIVDPNPRTGMMHDRDAFLTNLEALAADALLVKVGDDDAAVLADESLDVFADRLLATGAHAVLTTAGRDGAGVRTSDGVRVSVGISDLPGPIVDTMGAGDAVLASAVATIHASGQPTDAAGWAGLLGDAMLVAAATCRSEGALLKKP